MHRGAGVHRLVEGGSGSNWVERCEFSYGLVDLKMELQTEMLASSCIHKSIPFFNS